MRGSRLVDITFKSTDPKFAAQRGEHADERVRRSESAGQAWRRRRTCSSGCEAKSTSSRRRCEESERALADYREKQNAMSLDDKQNIVAHALPAAERRAHRRRATRRRRRRRSTTRSRRMRATRRGGYRFRRSPRTRRCSRSRPSSPSCSSERAQLAEKYGDKHPQMQANAAQIAGSAERSSTLETARALQTVKNDYDTAVLEERTLRAEPRRRQGRRAGSRAARASTTT